jgi:YHS domain-containing protein
MLKRVMLGLTALALPLLAGGSALAQGKKAATCPVMKTEIKDPAKAPKLMVNNEPVHFCCPGCDAQLKKSPAKYLKTVKDPVTGKPFAVTAKTPKMEHGGGLFLFSSHATHEKFHAAPGKYVKHGKPGGHKDHH